MFIYVAIFILLFLYLRHKLIINIIIVASLKSLDETII